MHKWKKITGSTVIKTWQGTLEKEHCLPPDWSTVVHTGSAGAEPLKGSSVLIWATWLTRRTKNELPRSGRTN